MAESRTRRPSGFTLVEMLVVIAIIAILAGILIPVGAVVMGNARRASNGLEIADLSQAIQKYRSENGGLYPPSFGEAQAMTPVTTYTALYNNGTGPWRNTLLGRYVNKAYPKCSQRDIAYLFTQVADNVDQCSALHFWLTQTSADARYPFTGPTKRTYLDFDETRLVQIGFIAGNPMATPVIPNLTLNGYRPRHAGESYYIYIEARHYTQHVSDNLSAIQSATNPTRPPAGTGPTASRTPDVSVRPWLRRLVNNANPTTDRMTAANYVNPESYQLFCAGLDGRFTVNHDLLRKFPCGPTGLDHAGNQINPNDFADDVDNQTNFSDGATIGSVPAQ
jgi:prepilin-type N-terminal cleavage/methylation domain-containing protein